MIEYIHVHFFKIIIFYFKLLQSLLIGMLHIILQQTNFFRFINMPIYITQIQFILYLYQMNCFKEKESSKKIILGYWGIGGRAHYLRYLLAYSGLNWEDKLYMDKDQWFAKDKPNSSAKYPNLPYVYDGSTMVTQNQSVWRYIIRRSGKTQLEGKNIFDQARVDAAMSIITDIFQNILGIIMNPNCDAQKDKYFKQKLQKVLGAIQSTIQPNSWYLGYLTVADFFLAVQAMYIGAVWPGKLQIYPNIKYICDKINDLPEIRKYKQKGVTRFFPFQSKVNA